MFAIVLSLATIGQCSACAKAPSKQLPPVVAKPLPAPQVPPKVNPPVVVTPAPQTPVVVPTPQGTYPVGPRAVRERRGLFGRSRRGR